MSQLQVKRIGYAAGAEVTGVDLRQMLDDATIAAIRQAWLDHLVLYFPDQDIDADQLAAFTRRFGALDANELAPKRGLDVVHPDVIVNTNKPLDGSKWDGFKVGTYWHTDRSFAPVAAIGTFIVSKAMPEVGGDTLFANQYMAYETLSPALRGILDGLTGIHDSSKAKGGMGSRPPGEFPPPVLHPLVKIHAETKRKALYIGERVFQIDGMTEEESGPLLRFLNEHAVRYEFVYRHHWKPNMLVMWDNRCILHYAVSDYDLRNEQRTLLRCSLQGDDWAHEVPMLERTTASVN